MPNNKSNNVNVSEIAKFDALAADWWDPKGSMSMLHLMNPVRLQFVQTQVALTAQKIVDVGCGGGLLSEAMAKQGAIVTAIDLSQELIAVAKAHAVTSGLSIDYQVTAVEELATRSEGQFDVLTAMELLEHVPDPKQLIEAAARLVKPNGKLFFSTINRNLKSYLLTIIGAEYVLGLLPKGTHQYAEFIRPSELTRWAAAANLSPISFMGMRYHPLKKQFELCADVSVNYLACFVKNG